jgi:hypothetical protein
MPSQPKVTPQPVPALAVDDPVEPAAQHYSKKRDPSMTSSLNFDGGDHDDAPDHEVANLDLMEKAQCSKRLFYFKKHLKLPPSPRIKQGGMI